MQTVDLVPNPRTEPGRLSTSPLTIHVTQPGTKSTPASWSPLKAQCISLFSLKNKHNPSIKRQEVQKQSFQYTYFLSFSSHVPSSECVLKLILRWDIS